MNSSAPGTPRSAQSPNRELTPSSGGGSAKTSSKPNKTTGESLGSLVGASMTVVGDEIYVFGGFDQYTDEVFNTLYKLSYTPEYRWTSIIYTKGRPPAKRNDHTATLWGKNMLVIFGGNGEEDGRYFNDVSVLNLDNLTWCTPETTGIRPEGRMRHSATIYDDKLYIAGGLLAPNTFADSLAVLDLRTWEWLPPIKFVRRSQHVSFMYNKRLYLFGGFEEDMRRSNHLAFIDLERHGVTHLEIDSPSAPSLVGQRFSQICGDQLVVAVAQPFSPTLSDGASTTGLWSLDLPSMQWQYRETGGAYEVCNWHSFAMAEHDTSFYLFGTSDDDPDEYYRMVLRIDLKEYGIVPVPPSQLGADLIGLLIQQSQSADFAIKSSLEPEAGELRVHRLVLLARWPHFDHMLSSGMSESMSNVLTMPERFQVLEAFVRFLYTDTLEESMPLVLTADLLVMANLYILPRLLALCVRRLHANMNVESVSKIYHCAGRAGQRGLRQTALHFILERFGAVSRTAGFRALPKEVLFELWDDIPENAMIVAYGNGFSEHHYHHLHQQHQHHQINNTMQDDEDDEDDAVDTPGPRPDSPMET